MLFSPASSLRRARTDLFLSILHGSVCRRCHRCCRTTPHGAYIVKNVPEKLSIPAIQTILCLFSNRNKHSTVNTYTFHYVNGVVISLSPSSFFFAYCFFSYCCCCTQYHRCRPFHPFRPFPLRWKIKRQKCCVCVSGRWQSKCTPLLLYEICVHDARAAVCVVRMVCSQQPKPIWYDWHWIVKGNGEVLLAGTSGNIHRMGNGIEQTHKFPSNVNPQPEWPKIWSIPFRTECVCCCRCLDSYLHASRGCQNLTILRLHACDIVTGTRVLPMPLDYTE